MKKTTPTPTPAAAPAVDMPPVRRRARAVLYTISDADVTAHAERKIDLKAGEVITVTAMPARDSWLLIGSAANGQVLRFPDRTDSPTPKAGHWHDATAGAVEVPEVMQAEPAPEPPSAAE